jgi:hypothetical protein
MAKKNETPTKNGFEKKVDGLFEIRSQIEELSSQAAVLETSLKDEGRKFVSGFGSVNLLGEKANAQIQVRRPSCSIPSDHIEPVKKVLGPLFPVFFKLETDGREVLKESKKEELKKLIENAGKDPEDFFTVSFTAKANDNFLDGTMRKALKLKDSIFDSVIKFSTVKGSLDGVIALKFLTKKEE